MWKSWPWMLLHLPGNIAGHGQWRCAGCHHRRADFRRVRLQAHLLVVVQLADDDAGEVFVVFVAGVQKSADLSGACGLVDHQFVILFHQHGVGQQGVQALVQTSLCHLGDNFLTPDCNPLGDGTLQRRRVPRWRRVTCNKKKLPYLLNIAARVKYTLYTKSVRRYKPMLCYANQLNRSVTCYQGLLVKNKGTITASLWF